MNSHSMDAANDTCHEPLVLSIQPLPELVRVCHKRTSVGWVTAISRDWAPGEGERCMLCPAEHCCLNTRGNCLRQFDGFVEAGSAALFADPLLGIGDRPALGLHISRA